MSEREKGLSTIVEEKPYCIMDTDERPFLTAAIEHFIRSTQPSAIVDRAEAIYNNTAKT